MWFHKIFLNNNVSDVGAFNLCFVFTKVYQHTLKKEVTGFEPEALSCCGVLMTCFICCHHTSFVMMMMADGVNYRGSGTRYACWAY